MRGRERAAVVGEPEHAYRPRGVIRRAVDVHQRVVDINRPHVGADGEVNRHAVVRDERDAVVEHVPLPAPRAVVPRHDVEHARIQTKVSRLDEGQHWLGFRDQQRGSEREGFVDDVPRGERRERLTGIGVVFILGQREEVFVVRRFDC